MAAAKPDLLKKASSSGGRPYKAAKMAALRTSGAGTKRRSPARRAAPDESGVQPPHSKRAGEVPASPRGHFLVESSPMPGAIPVVRSGPAFKPPRFIVVEGPIRVGKSTLAKVLADRLHARRIFDCDDNPFLGDFYNEVPGAAFRSQLYFLFERFRRLRESQLDQIPGAVVSDFLFEKDKIFAYLNLDNEELKLYEKYYELLAAEAPVPDLVIYLQAKPEVLQQRIARKADPAERQVSEDYLEEVIRAYEHFFFRYASSDLLVVNTSEIDFVDRNEDLQELLKRLQQPVKGTQYFLPLGPS